MLRARTFHPQGENRLLHMLPVADRERIMSMLVSEDMGRGQVVIRAGQPVSHVYFPLNSALSVILNLQDGSSIEVATIGNEGMAGVSLLLNDAVAYTDTICQVPDGALTMRASDFRTEINRGGAFHDVIGRYATAYLNLITQCAARNRFHSIEERAARWLLMTHDRVGRDEFQLTHEFLAIMLGVRRAGVTVAAGTLQANGLIRYHCGTITILDRDRLEHVSCECYQQTRDEFDRLVP